MGVELKDAIDWIPNTVFQNASFHVIQSGHPNSGDMTLLRRLCVTTASSLLSDSYKLFII